MAEHNGMPRLGNDRSVDDDYEEVVAYPAPAQPHYQDYHEDSTTMDPSDIWREFESARSSAEYHLDEYLRYLAQSCPAIDGETCRDLEPAQNRIAIRRKIAQDSAIRDLVAMETILAYVKTLTKPSGFPTAAALCTLACGVSSAVIPLKSAIILSQVGFVGGAIALTAPPAWKRYQKYSLDAARISVHHLRLAFEEDIGLVDDESRNVLKKSRFNFLKWEFAYL